MEWGSGRFITEARKNVDVYDTDKFSFFIFYDTVLQAERDYSSILYHGLFFIYVFLK